ncbi:hypothetical protein THICB3310099 [Thiomonas sp. CB3]|nr:hypothetical protein THICB3310099 [Thiomonas sp. CB3]
MAWSHVKRMGARRRGLHQDEKLRDKIERQFTKLQTMLHRIRSFSKAASAAYRLYSI